MPNSQLLRSIHEERFSFHPSLHILIRHLILGDKTRRMVGWDIKFDGNPGYFWHPGKWFKGIGSEYWRKWNEGCPRIWLGPPNRLTKVSRVQAFEFERVPVAIKRRVDDDMSATIGRVVQVPFPDERTPLEAIRNCLSR